MKWMRYLFSFGCLLLSAIIPSAAKGGQNTQNIKTFVCDFSEHHKVKVLFLSIVQPDPVPESKPMPDPGENPKPL